MHNVAQYPVNMDFDATIHIDPTRVEFKSGSTI
jgi:hypothetical protein